MACGLGVHSESFVFAFVFCLFASLADLLADKCFATKWRSQSATNPPPSQIEFREVKLNEWMVAVRSPSHPYTGSAVGEVALAFFCFVFWAGERLLCGFAC